MAVPVRGRADLGRSCCCPRIDGRPSAHRIAGRSSPASASGVLYVGNSGTYYASLETVSPSLAALVVYLYPAVVAVLSIRFGHRLQGRRAWIALGIALIGVVLAVGGIDPNDAPPVSGLALAFASCFIYAVWVILAARVSGERREAVADESGQVGSATASSRSS